MPDDAGITTGGFWYLKEMQKVDMVKVDARKLLINLGCIKKIPLYPPLQKGEVKELYTKPFIL